jgi:streptogramin lyase
MGKNMSNQKFRNSLAIALVISALGFQYACNTPNNTINTQNEVYNVDLGKGQKGVSFEINISEKNLGFSTKDNKSGGASRKLGDIRSYKVYLLRSSSSVSYSSGSDPLKDAVSDAVINVGASPVHKIKLNNIQGSTYSLGTGEYYYIALRAFSGSNATGTELIKVNNGDSTPWSGITSSSPRVAVSSTSGIQVVHKTLQISSTSPISISVNLDGAIGAQLDTNVTVNLGAAGSSVLNGAFSANSRVFTYAGVSIQNGTSRTLAQLAQPEEMAFDSNGNLYIADRNSHRILKMDKTTEMMSVFAGDGSASTTPKTGDGGLATDAKLKEPCGITIDSQDNIYVVESIHGTVRKIDKASNIITTVAGSGIAGYSGDGGQASLANLSSPENVVVDSSGNIYIADSFNQRVRKVDQSGIISTIAGNDGGCSNESPSGTIATNACIGQITGLALDSDNNIYMSDKLNHRIWKLDSQDNKIYYIAGNGSVGSSGDGGFATDASLGYPSYVSLDENNNKLYITDSGNNRFRVVDLSTTSDPTKGTINLLMGSTIGNSPSSPALYSDPSVLFKLDDNNSLGTRIGGSIIVGPNGNFYVADRFNNKIRIVYINNPPSPYPNNIIDDYIRYMLPNAGNSGNPLQQYQATTAQLSYPTAMALGRDGFLYFSDRNNQIIRRVNTSTGIITRYSGTLASVCTPATSVCGDGGQATATAVKFNTPHDITIDSIGNLYIADRSDQRIRKITKSSGIITTIAGNGVICPNSTTSCGDGGNATAANLNFPSAVSLDKYGNLYIVDRDNHKIRKVDPTTNIITTVVGTGTQGFSGDGDLATNAQLNQPYEIVFDVNDNMYIADRTNKRVRRVDAVTGIITTYAGDGRTCKSTSPAVPYPCGDGGQATDASFNEPVSVAIDSIGNLYILDKLDYRIRKVDTTTGKISTVLGTGSWGLTADGVTALNSKVRAGYGFYIDPYDTVYIGDSENGVIRYIK